MRPRLRRADVSVSGFGGPSVGPAGSRDPPDASLQTGRILSRPMPVWVLHTTVHADKQPSPAVIAESGLAQRRSGRSIFCLGTVSTAPSLMPNLSPVRVNGSSRKGRDRRAITVPLHIVSRHLVGHKICGFCVGRGAQNRARFDGSMDSAAERIFRPPRPHILLCKRQVGPEYGTGCGYAVNSLSVAVVTGIVARIES